MLFESIFLGFSLLVAYQPMNKNAISNDSLHQALTYNHENVYVTQLSPKIDFYFWDDKINWNINGAARIETVNPKEDESIWFRPYQLNSTFETSITLANITLGASHVCSHSIITHGMENYNDPVLFDWSNTEFFVNIDMDLQLK